MTPKRKRVGSLAIAGGSVLFLAAGLVLAMKWNSRHSPSSADGVKGIIYKSLAKKAGRTDFTPEFDFDLPNRLATLRSNANSIERRTASLRASQSAAEREMAPLRRELDGLRDETRKAKSAAAELKIKLKEAEKRTPVNAAEIAALQSEYEKIEKLWKAKGTSVSEKEAEIAVKARELSPLAEQLREVESELRAAREACHEKENELGKQENAFIGACRQRASELRNYEAIYLLIGQQLTAADRLLAEPEISRRCIGVSFAREACRHAGEAAQDEWLAARICEAYLWPNLDLADSPGSKEHALDILRYGRAMFVAANETNNVAKTHALLLSNAPNAEQADTFRLEFADFLEQRRELNHALMVLKEIQEPTVQAAAAERLARISDAVRP